ncbi:MAG: hypothetical protein AAFZ80_05825 [Cyanobacteria bacterium P01_A01_bin.105]
MGKRQAKSQLGHQGPHPNSLLHDPVRCEIVRLIQQLRRRNCPQMMVLDELQLSSEFDIRLLPQTLAALVAQRRG